MLTKIIPPSLLVFYLKNIKSSNWIGNYPSWSAAAGDSSSYAGDEIINKVISATKKVVKGEATYERDSVLFHEENYEWTLLSMLFYAYGSSKSNFHLVDFGGSFGSLYFQHKKLLPKDILWTVIEQEHFVQKGKEHFETEHLHFENSIKEAHHYQSVNCVLLSCCIQYLEDPNAILDELNTSTAENIIFFNTPFSYTREEIICVQRVNKKIYEASYPCRFIPLDNVLSRLSNYECVIQHDSGIRIYHNHNAIPYEAILLKRKTAN